jgi:hypothetical protein
MRKWGLIVSLFYGVVLVVFLVPLSLFLFSASTLTVANLKEAYSNSTIWIIFAVFMIGAALLLCLRVDITPAKLKPRTPIIVSAIATGMLLTVLTVTGGMSLLFAIGSENVGLDSNRGIVTACVILLPWLFWGILFYRFYRDAADPVTHAISWLFRGSVLELLVVVPSHVIVRRRNDCCAPAVTSFGITSGLAIMLLSFGPSVLLLYKKRMEKYSTKI